MSDGSHLRRIEEWLCERVEQIRRLVLSLEMHNNQTIFFANALMICIWIAGIIGMIIMYATIETRYKADPNSGSNLFKIIYALCHWIISIILYLYVFVNTCYFSEATTNPSSSITRIQDWEGGSNQHIMTGGNTFKMILDSLLSVPINMREDINKFITKFNNPEHTGDTYKTQINLGVMFRLVVAHFPIIIFLIIFTSIVAMIKAYHKILCGNANMSVIIDWPYRIIDIVIYAVFRLFGFIIILFNLFSPKTQLSTILAIFYFTAVYLIIRFILLLYENTFSNTIVSLYKWDIRETDCNTNNSDMTGNWILDTKARKAVKDRQNLADPYKLTNDVFSLIFNILIILFLSGISIASVCLLYIYSDNITLITLLKLTTQIGYKTVTPMPTGLASAQTTLAKLPDQQTLINAVRASKHLPPAVQLPAPTTKEESL